MKWRGALCLLALLAVRSAIAKPDYWTDPANSAQPDAPSSVPACTAHPDGGYGEHGAPAVDATITFALAASGKAVTSVCPGKSYTLSVTWPAADGTGGYGIVTTTVGTLADSRDTCKNRAIYEEFVPTHTTTIAVPAATTAKSLELAATFANAPDDSFHQNSATIPISSTGCTTTTAAAPAPAPTTGTTTTAKPTTTTAAPPSPEDDERSGKSKDDNGDDNPKGTTYPAPSGTTGTPSTTGTTTTGTTSTGTATTGTTATAGSASVTAFTASMCKQPVQTKSASCTTSTLGYSCSHTAGALTTHWTVGGCAPSNACTKTYTVRNSALDAAQPYLHYAATYKTTGYVAVGFAKNPGSMAGTDAVLGWVNDDGSPTVEAYHVTSGDSLSARAAYSGDSQWLALSGASVTADGYTTVCFSRPLNAPTSNVLKTVPVNKPVGMNWAVGGQRVRSLREHTIAKGFTFDPITGATTVKDAADKYYKYHGILMALAWVVLAPLGVLFARHRWALGDFKLGKVHFWFHAHRAIQFLAVILFAGGLALAYTKLGEPSGGIGKAHSTLAILLCVLAGLQVVAAFIRPAGDAPNRRYWNLFHWNLGRLTLATGIINVFIGVVVYDSSTTLWFAVLGSALAAWVIAEVVLSLLSLKKGSAEAAASGPGKDIEEVEVARLGQQQQQQQYQYQQHGGRPLYPQHSGNVV